MPTNTGATSAIGISPILTFSGFSGVPPPRRRRRRHPRTRSRPARSPPASRAPLSGVASSPPPPVDCSRLISRYTCARRRANSGSSFVSTWSRGCGRSTLSTSRTSVGDGREHDDAVGQVDRLVDVVGHEQHGHAVLLADPQDEVLQVAARLRVDRGEQLVHEQDLRLVGERPRDRHPLLHAARELHG